MEPKLSSARSPEEIVAIRRRHLNPCMSIAYEEPLKIVRGEGQYLIDHQGQRYLDMVNNVSHVGHCHPKVVEAGQKQMAILNTNTRYLHDYLVEYTLSLLATMPAPLEVCFFTNSGTEANDLAIRLAQAHTGGRDVIVLEHAYHGNSPTMIDISPYKHDGQGGKGTPEHVQKVPMPDGFRGPHRYGEPDIGKRYGQYVRQAVERIETKGRHLSAFFCESLLGCGGQIILPDGYLKEAYAHVRAAGGVCVADEVQVGFGRVGSCMWAFERQEVVPDIVTLGKPIGNGHPVAAVITTAKIASSFNTGMEYFNTFGGNPVSCAIGLAVLRVIQQEGLQENAKAVGQHLLEGLGKLQKNHPLVGDVRGVGLFVGVELVRHPKRLDPATQEAHQIIQMMKAKHILLSTEGPFENVLKIKPPIVFNHSDADSFLSALDECLAAL